MNSSNIGTVKAVAPGRAPDPQADLPPWMEADESCLSIGGVKDHGYGALDAPRVNGWTCI